MEALSNHRLWQTAMRHTFESGLVKRFEDQSFVPDELEYYDFRVSHSLVHLFDLIGQLQDTAKLLNNYPDRNSGISSFRYMIYTLENWYIRAGSVGDRVINLINNVFHLGIHKAGSADFVLKNLNVSRTAVPALYSSLDKVLSKHRSTRNTIVHAESLAPEEMQRLATLYSYDDAMIVEHPDEQFRANVKRVRARDLAKAREAQMRELGDRNLNIEKAVIPILDALVTVHVRQRKRLTAYLGRVE